MALRTLLTFDARKLFEESRRNDVRIAPASLADPVELNNVEASFAQFNATYERALPFQPVGKLPLGQLRARSHRDQFHSKCVVQGRENRLFHARDLRAKTSCTQNAGMLYFRNSREYFMSNRPSLTLMGFVSAFAAGVIISGCAFYIDIFFSGGSCGPSGIGMCLPSGPLAILKTIAIFAAGFVAPSFGITEASPVAPYLILIIFILITLPLSGPIAYLTYRLIFKDTNNLTSN